jgi:hypothetical protein
VEDAVGERGSDKFVHGGIIREGQRDHVSGGISQLGNSDKAVSNANAKARELLYFLAE